MPHRGCPTGWGAGTSSAWSQAGGLAGDPAPVKSAEERIIYGVCFEIPLNRKEQPVGPHFSEVYCLQGFLLTTRGTQTSENPREEVWAQAQPPDGAQILVSRKSLPTA